MAFGICYALGCNYRNVTVAFAAGDTQGLMSFAYSITFYTLPGSSNQTAFPAALAAALPSNLICSATGNPTWVPPGCISPGGLAPQPTVAYGMAFTQGGALGTLINVTLGYGSFAPPPSPPSPLAYACTCTDGYAGADCSVPPFGG